jgi:hypothetical protein
VRCRLCILAIKLLWVFNMMKMGIGTSDLFGMRISDFVPRSKKLLGRRVYKKTNPVKVMRKLYIFWQKRS